MIGGLMRRLRRAAGALVGAERASLGTTFVSWLREAIGGGGEHAPMTASSAAYAGIMAIARTVRSLPLVLHRAGDRNAVVTRGAAYELLQRPMPHTTYQDWAEQWTGHLIEGGEAHVLLLGEAQRGRITQLPIAGARQMQARTDADGELLRWDYTPLGGSVARPIFPEEDAYRRLFHPHDRHRGLSPLRVAALAVQLDNLGSRYNVAALKQGGTPSGFFTVPGTPSEQEREEYAARIRERYLGVDKTKVGFLWGGADYRSVAMTNTDLQLLESRKFSRDEVLNVLGVPPVIVAMFEAAHYDVADKSIEIFLTFTVAAYATSLCETLNLMVLPRVERGIECTIDLGAHPIMQRIGWERVDVFGKLLANAVPYNEAGRIAGLPLAPQQWGDTSVLPGTFAPAADVATGIEPLPELPEETPSDRPDGLDDAPEDGGEEARQAASARADARADERLMRVLAPRIVRGYRAWFAALQRDALRRLRAALPRASAGVERAMSGSEIAAIVERVMWSSSVEQDRVRAMVRAYFPEGVLATLRAELERVGADDERIEQIIAAARRGRMIQSYVATKESRIAGVERVTRTRLRRELSTGLGEGESLAELSERVRLVLGGNAARANRIARTEAGQAVSLGRYVAAAESGARAKAWLTGPNPRETHIMAGAKYGPTDAIAIDALFEVGKDRLLFPRDARGSAGEIVNCNCVMVSVTRPAHRGAAR